MSSTPQELELFRSRFLDQLNRTQPELSGHQQFLQYWQVIQREAELTKDVDQLDNWVRALARDKDKVKALEARIDAQDRENPMIAGLLQILRMVLDVLEGVEKKLRKRRDAMQRRLAVFLLRAGPGVLKKPKPGEDEEAGKGDDKDKKGDAQQQALIAQKPPAPPQPKTPPEQQKKLER